MQVELRRGLPRVAGGDPWPPAGTVEVEGAPAAPAAPAAPVAAPADTAPAADTVEVPLRRGLPRVPGGDPWPPAGTVRVVAPRPSQPAAAEAGAADAALDSNAADTATDLISVPLRRGLPRVQGTAQRHLSLIHI